MYGNGIFGRGLMGGFEQSFDELVLETSSVPTYGTQVAKGYIPSAQAQPLSISGACNSNAVIRWVQNQIGTEVDGIWGPNSRAALAKAGGTFKSYAPECTGAPPNGGTFSSSTSSQVATTTPVTSVLPVEAGAMSKLGFLSGKFVGIPIWGWLAVAAAGGVYMYYQSEKEGEASANKKRGGKAMRKKQRKLRMKEEELEDIHGVMHEDIKHRPRKHRKSRREGL